MLITGHRGWVSVLLKDIGDALAYRTLLSHSGDFPRWMVSPSHELFPTNLVLCAPLSRIYRQLFLWLINLLLLYFPSEFTQLLMGSCIQELENINLLIILCQVFRCPHWTMESPLVRLSISVLGTCTADSVSPQAAHSLCSGISQNVLHRLAPHPCCSECQH